MGIYSNWQKDIIEDYAELKEKPQTTEGRKWVKYAAYGILTVVLLLFVSCVSQSMFRPRVVANPLDYSKQAQYTSIMVRK